MKISPAPSFPIPFPIGTSSLSLTQEEIFSCWKKPPLPKIFWFEPPNGISEPPSPETLYTALRNPIHHLPFLQWLLPEKKLLIVLPDHTRRTGMETLLSHLVSLLPDSFQEICFLVGTGSHHSSREMMKPLYPPLLSSYPFHFHTSEHTLWWKPGYT
ncbi:MAG: lactate racemase domain-containing protein, partial [bacterium]